MRLIELRLKNLNSLKGEWHINFNDAAFINEGIFAITGQTGAGKTTILDAICLALYGETPRISISKNSNEVMTRQTGECFAEVVIDLGGKYYRCRWGQRRAYNKPDGNLQDATHEIARIKSYTKTQLENLPSETGDEIIESKLSRTKEKIIELTRMDFQQFTRSILLAQGSFSAFLKAKSDERADILEKITGTSIYATISEHVFVTKRDKEAKLNELKAATEGVEILTEKEEQSLHAALQSLRLKADTYRTELQSVNEQLKWLETVDDLTQKINQYRIDIDQAKQASLNFAADSSRLERANQALELESDFSQLIHTRQNVDKWQQDKQAITKQLPYEQANLNKIASALDAAQKHESQMATTLERSLPIFATVRKLDVDIRQIDQSLTEDKDRHAQQSSLIARLKKDIANNQQSQQDTQQQWESVNKFLTDHQHLASLASDIAHIDSTCTRIKSLLLDNRDLDKDSLALQSQLDQHQNKLEALKRQIAANQDQIKSEHQSLTQAQRQQSALLNHQSLNHIRHQQDQLDDSSFALENLNHHLNQLDDCSAKLLTLTNDLPKLQNTLLKSQQKINTLSDALTSAKQQRDDQQNQLALLQQVAKLEDYIDQLESGSPCPLCGATEHPYSDQHPLQDTSGSFAADTGSFQSKIAQTESKINQLTQQMHTLQNQLSEAQIRQATDQNNRARLDADFNDLQKTSLNIISVISSQLTELSTLPSLTSLTNKLDNLSNTFAKLDDKVDLDHTLEAAAEQPATLQAIQQSVQTGLMLIGETKAAINDRRGTLKQLLADFDTLSTRINTIEKQITQSERTASELSAKLGEVHFEQKLTRQQLQSNNSSLNANFEELQSILAILDEAIDKYQPAIPSQYSQTLDMTTYQTLQLSINSRQVLAETDIKGALAMFDQFRTRLDALKNHYEDQLTAKQRLNTLISNLAIQIKSYQSQLDEAEQTLDQIDHQIQNKTDQLTALTQQRRQKLLDDDPDTKESQLRRQVEEAKSKLNHTQRQYDTSKHHIKQLTDQHHTITEQLLAAKAALATQESRFHTRLNTLGFSDELSFKSARLAKSDRDALSRQQQQIDNNLQQSQSLLAQSNNLLATKLAKPLTNQSQEELIDRQQHLQDLINHLYQEIGGVEQQLEANDALKQKHQSQQAAIDAQRQELLIWQQLYELIGSANGKKYRTFAQGLTFDIMVSHANLQLQKMSDRYLLIRDNDSPLELNVIDNYQGGEIRSTKNLSGGEGFIISLALALGLSQMASQQADKNIRVDSLFLDEGFGTLDEDSLDIALDTLSNLQQEGKLIGVISHVQALKDRILTQIKVEKLSGGHSQIIGAGCQKIAS